MLQLSKKMWNRILWIISGLWLYVHGLPGRSVVEWNSKHYELEKMCIEENNTIISYFLDVISMFWSIEYTTKYESITNILNMPSNILMQNDNINELNGKIITQYNKIIFYQYLKKIYEEAIIELDDNLEQLEKMAAVVDVYSLRVAIKFKKEQIVGLLRDVNHTLSNLSQEYDKKLLLNPSPFHHEAFIIPMKKFDIKKLGFYVNNSYMIKNHKNKFNHMYHNPVNGLQSQILYDQKNKRWSMHITYFKDFKEALQSALKLEEELISLKSSWIKTYHNIRSKYLLIRINKMQIKNIKTHINIIKKQIILLKNTKNNGRYFYKIYKLQQQLLDLKINLLKIEEERANNIWQIFLSIAPVNYCKIVYLLRPSGY